MMSLNFHANQYERSFRSNPLGNWEVSKWYPHERPRARRGHTKVIADDRGHLLPGVPRIEPWGHFKSTWQLPKRITRKLARDINTLRPSGKHLTSWEKRSSHIPLIEKTSTPPLPPTSKEKRISSAKKEIPIVEDPELKLNEYQPYGKDEHDYSPQMGADRTTKILDASQRVREDIESYSQSCRGTPPKKVETSLSHSRRSSAKSRKSSKSSRASTPKRDALSTPPINLEYLSPQYAKDQAQDNLKHQPLPDMINDQIFQSMQMKSEKYPGIGIENSPKAVAVGHKKFVSPGPTQCSKLKVYRPKTASTKLPEKILDRPKTGITKSIGPIDLAICWDLIPENPSSEPKRPTHIDGSNGSIAPSVFTIVKPKEDSPFPIGEKSHISIAKELEEREKQKELRKARPAWESENPPSHDKPVNPSAVMDIINNNLEVVKKENKINEEFRRSVSSGRGSDKHLNEIKHGCKNSLSGSEENHNPNIPSRKSSENSKKYSKSYLESSLDSDKLAKQKHYRSSPNLSTMGVENSKSKQKMLFSRPCMACETKLPLEAHPKSKSDYKMAFKAGVPNSGAHTHRTDSSKSSIKQLSVPKPKTPFARRSYSINTLAPPFSLWPGTTGMDYPEHWRLASVYQHSYKPVEQRKKPLLQGVFH